METSRAARTSAAADAATTCETLDLNVRDHEIIWSHNRSQLNGERQELSHDDAPIDLSCKNTLELLADVQRWLVGLGPEEKLQQQQVDGVLYRVACVLGEHLYAVLFADAKLRALLDGALLRLDNGALELLRIELEFSGKSANFASWPWEYLRTPSNAEKNVKGRFLALSTKLVLNRTLSDRFRDAFSTKKPVFLLVVSGPRACRPVIGSEVVTKLKELSGQQLIELHELVEPPHQPLLGRDYRPTASWTAFREQLKALSPHVIHFIGHGRLSFDAEQEHDTGQLAFVGRDGKPDWRSETEFAEAVASSNPNLRLVFLQACDSAISDPRANMSGLAMSLAQLKVPGVVAMQAKVENSAANTFANTFYDLLQTRRPLDWIVMESRKALADIDGLTQSQKLAFGVPVLYLSSYDALLSAQADQEDGTTLSAGKTANVAESPPAHSSVPQGPPICPNAACHFALRDLARLPNFCPSCGLSLICPKCRLALEVPNVKGGFCGNCRHRIEPLQAEGGVASAKNDLRSLVGERAAPAAPPTANADLVSELARAYPLLGQPGVSGV